MRSFYQQCFGFDAVDIAENYCVLESASWTLSLVMVPDEAAATVRGAVPPRRRGEAPVKLAFEVPSIEDLRTMADSLGGQVDPSPTQWDFRGSRHCDGVDPEGCQWPSVSPHWRPLNSRLVAIVSPRWWPSDLPIRGHRFSPAGGTGFRSGSRRPAPASGAPHTCETHRDHDRIAKRGLLRQLRRHEQLPRVN
jgi:hypothetical protein